MTIAQVVVGILTATNVGAIITAVLLWLRHRKLDAAQVADTGASADERRANARVTDLEAWEQMRNLRTGLVQDLASLQTEVSAMRGENAALADQHRAALAHIVAIHEWDAAGRRGPMPTAPVDLKLAAT